MTLTTSRKCPQCRNEVTPTARFCAECGSSMTPTEMASTPAPRLSPGIGMPPPLATARAEHVDDITRKAITGVLIGTVVLLSIMVAVLAVMLRHTTVASSQPCVTAPALGPAAPAGAGEAHLPSAASLSPPSTPQASSPSAGSVVATGAAAATVSPDTASYLTFIQTTEQKRAAIMTAPQASAASTDSNGQTTDTQAQLQSLITEFQSRRLPEGFGQFAQDYLTFLVDCQALKPVDQLSADASKADTDLNNLCTTLRVVKPVTIAVAGPAPTVPESGSPPTDGSTPDGAPTPPAPPAPPAGQP